MKLDRQSYLLWVLMLKILTLSTGLYKWCSTSGIVLCEIPSPETSEATRPPAPSVHVH